MNKIIANISIGLLLSCSMISFGMNNPEGIYISEAKLLKYSPVHDAYSPVNIKNKMPKLSIDEVEEKPIRAKYGTLRLQNNQLEIICKSGRVIPIEGPIDSNKLRSLQSTPYGDLIAIDNKDHQYIIENYQYISENKVIDWKLLPVTKKTVTIIPISGPIANMVGTTMMEYNNNNKYPGSNTVIHTNAVLQFNERHARILYQKNNEIAKKRFNKDSLTLTPDTLKKLQIYKEDKTPFYFEITNNESGEKTGFFIKRIEGNGEVLEYNDPYIPTKSLISSLKQLLTHRFTLTGMGAIVLLFIAHYSDYFSNNINITQTLSKLFNCIKQ